jgi:hypothetical protein
LSGSVKAGSITGGQMWNYLQYLTMLPITGARLLKVWIALSARPLGSWATISLEAWLSVWIYSVLVWCCCVVLVFLVVSFILALSPISYMNSSSPLFMLQALPISSWNHNTDSEVCCF